MKNNMVYYSINRGINTKLKIQIQEGEVIVKAPWYIRKDKIQKTIQEKRNWILAKINEYEEKKIENMNLRPITILGIEYNLKVCYKNNEKIECNLKENIVEVNMPKKYKKMDNELITNILMDKLYQKVAQRELEEIMEKLRINLGFAPEDYEIKEMKNCMAKCTEDKKIIINPKIAKYNKKTIEYIVLHQFCHLKYKTHAKGFWKLIEQYMPDYKDYEIKDYIY